MDTDDDDEDLILKQLYMEILKSIVEVSPGPDAFIFVVTIGRISRAASGLIEILPGLFGNDASKYTMANFILLYLYIAITRNLYCKLTCGQQQLYNLMIAIYKFVFSPVHVQSNI